MSLEFLIIIFLLLIMVILLMILFGKINRPDTNSNDLIAKWLTSMSQNINDSNKNVDNALRQTTEIINKRLDSAIGVVSETTKELTKMNELSQTIKDLNVILQTPKLRGNLGEEILSDMLAQVFPKDSYRLQFGFKSGARVDAAIKTVAGILPIDAKFPMENYQKMVQAEKKEERDAYRRQLLVDIKKHIGDIGKKYILTDEGTVDFAFMYVPSEAVFLEMAKQVELMSMARKLRVYPVSPNTLYAHLQTVLLSFEGLKIEKSAKQILSMLRALQRDYDKTLTSVELLGKHLNNANNQYSNTFSQINLMGQKLNDRKLLEE